ncbi:MAG: hypothetical protein Q8M98_10725 [Candidatus Cloacimonadaceae bacterium]|nr:hypothetical protein [Candidatus Cloacimonadaceae bacterium]MDP3115228.1 hypothetical protein [Candidatus Cloacimonadaceae bacterium]
MEKIIIISLVSLLLTLSVSLVMASVNPEDFWTDGYCVQKTALTPTPGAKSIRAEIDGEWKELPLVSFPAAFWDWNRNRRIEYLEIFREMLELGAEKARRPQLSGPHNGMVATYGAQRKDSAFKLNNAVKGMGFCPREDKIEELIERLKKTKDAPLAEKLDVLESLYKDAENIFAHDRLLSLELYSEPGFSTQTFINQMVNPACVTVFLDIPTYKIKQVVRLLHPMNPNLSKQERLMTEYVNLIHSYFHGEFPRDYIAAIYYSTEVYDSSPGRKDARGTKMSP